MNEYTCPEDRYHTEEEITFARDLSKKAPLAFLRYAELVLSGMRRYDKTVNVGRVYDAIEGLREYMGATYA